MTKHISKIQVLETYNARLEKQVSDFKQELKDYHNYLNMMRYDQCVQVEGLDETGEKGTQTGEPGRAMNKISEENKTLIM